MKFDRYTKQFNSIGALADFVAANKADITGSQADYVFKSDAQMSYNEAIERGQNGGYWPEGAENVKPVEMDLDSLDIHGMNMPRPEAAVMGYRPNVAAYLAGSPLSMYRMTPTHQPNRLVRVAVAVGKAFGVDAQTSFNRGSGILSVLNALHAGGFAIEIWAIWRNQDDSGNEVSIETLIKDSTDSYSPDSIAFSLCNDAFQRRLNWAALGIMHTQENNPIVDALISDHLGAGRKAKFEDFDLHYKWVESGHRWTKSGSADKARGIAETQLNANLASTGV